MHKDLSLITCIIHKITIECTLIANLVDVCIKQASTPAAVTGGLYDKIKAKGGIFLFTNSTKSPYTESCPVPNDSIGQTQPYFSQEHGMLPSQGLLAAAYVPEQRMSSPQYTKEEALKNGTLFPGLNLPYSNYYPTAEIANTPKGELMALSFVIEDLGLYLDTHPNDTKALELRNNFLRSYEKSKDRVSREYGPITSDTIMENGYTWIDEPWPWEKGC